MKLWRLSCKPWQSAPLCAVLLLSLGASTVAGDWAQYRGPLGNGSSPETIRTNWNEQEPSVLWRKPIGPGFSSITVSQGRLLTQERRTVDGAPREFCLCLDAATGEIIWAVDVGMAVYTDLAGYSEKMDGPRSTPSIKGDRVYVLTSYLKLYCLNLEDGSQIWMRDFRSEFGSTVIPWQNTASPLLENDLIFLNSNAGERSLTAIRQNDGTTAWRTQSDALTHATPVLAHFEGQPQVVFLTGEGLVSVLPDTGSVLWRLGFSPSYTSTAASPGILNNYAHASAAYAAGTWVAQIEKNGSEFTATQLYRERGNGYQLHWASPVPHEQFLYTIPSASSSQARLACLNVATGENEWEQTTVGSGNIGFGSLIKSANALIVLTENGELVLVEPTPDQYIELAKFQILDRYCWNNPALSNGRLYARNTSPTTPEIVAVDLALPGAGLPGISLAAFPSGSVNGITVAIRSLDGTNLTGSHAAQLELTATDNPSLSPEQWTPLDATLIAADGELLAEIPFGTHRARYIQAREKMEPNP